MGDNELNHEHRDILLKAIRRLDPNNELVPGTSDYRYTESMIIKWIRIHGPDQALVMVERSINLLQDVTKPKGKTPPKALVQ